MYATGHSSSRWLSFRRNEQDSVVYEVQGESLHISLPPALPDRRLGPTMGIKGSFLGAKRPKRDVDHLPLPGAKVKSECCCTSSSPVCLYRVGWVNFNPLAPEFFF